MCPVPRQNAGSSSCVLEMIQTLTFSFSAPPAHRLPQVRAPRHLLSRWWWWLLIDRWWTSDVPACRDSPLACPPAHPLFLHLQVTCTSHSHHIIYFTYYVTISYVEVTLQILIKIVFQYQTAAHSLQPTKEGHQTRPAIIKFSSTRKRDVLREIVCFTLHTWQWRLLTPYWKVLRKRLC